VDVNVPLHSRNPCATNYGCSVNKKAWGVGNVPKNMAILKQL